MEININDFFVKAAKKVNLKKLNTQAPEKLKIKSKELNKIVERIDYYQNILYAENKRSLLIIFQGIDAAGKDSSIRAIMTGVNPQGVEVSSFKTPNSLEYSYNYFWRHINKIPQKGKIGIFNRSHYENVLISKVHPEYILNEKLPNMNSVKDIDPDFFNRRYEEICRFEDFLYANGTKVIKFFLNISKEEQKKRFVKRIKNKEKNWKFSASDLKERKLWDKYQEAFTSALENTSTKKSPWYVIPCDDKPYGQLIMATIIKETLKEMNPQFPEVDKEEEKALHEAYQELIKEK